MESGDHNSSDNRRCGTRFVRSIDRRAEPPTMLSLDDAAALVSLHSWQLRDAIRRKEVAAYKPLGTRLRVDRQELLAWARRRACQ